MIKTALNHPSTNVFSENIGKFICNFGVIEMTTVELVIILSKDEVLTNLARKSFLNKRIEIIKELIKNNDISHPLQKSLNENLVILKPFMELRNIVAHNPISFAFPEGDTSNEPTYSGILNLRPKDKTKEAELIDIDELINAINNTASIAQKLRNDLDELRKSIKK